MHTRNMKEEKKSSISYYALKSNIFSFLFHIHLSSHIDKQTNIQFLYYKISSTLSQSCDSYGNLLLNFIEKKKMKMKREFHIAI